MQINWVKQEINFKIVYFGPGLSGKTTNLEYIYAHLKPSLRSELISLKTTEERTLYFDFLQVELSKIKGKTPRFFIYTIPGQMQYGYSRKLILKGADALVFVADSQRNRMEENLNSLMDLEEKLIAEEKSLQDIPWVLQYNKRDCRNIMPIELLNEKLNFLNVPYYKAVAVQGVGVFDTLKSAIQLAMNNSEL